MIVLPISLEMPVGLQHKMVSMSHVATVVCPSYTDQVEDDDACAFYVSCSFYASCACLSCSFSSAFSSETVMKSDIWYH